MSGTLLIKDKHTGNTIFSIDCEPDEVQENIDRVIEFEVYDFLATYDGKTVDGIEAGLSFGKFATWSIAWALTVIAATWFLAWPVEISGQ